ncbi:hypothetical protein FNF27_06740 [Cafeteria roenbergensis]|uniref:ER lumen protein-retaining receptor n=1 Tax=Cafeteria roenbergensis TaxID=33653 RepID=A0A5A8CR53_CAFRO|nr:hypothetical protein FNF28_06853 [Cafeteria roenbergensis]KAA0154301.1 hypothetical protein FNF29_02521 [Cafeteria roenbergensis]KAA0155525.1 hypothetical protein FNF31_06064 [Cafeteria roenbergensis]KAA0170148.1 hypothetical protein FNF27_06740 [Cafeteria roenbergensis]|eukprot:KAA0154301.1 hypothetical protein FNF29_02521 [Cafeteria roenbergensis]
MMNIFRFVGDMSHLASFFLLLAKLIYTKSSTGVSLKTQALYLTVFVCRYLDLLVAFVSWYNELMKIFFIAASAYIVYVVATSTRNSNASDTYRVEFLVIPALVLACFVNETHWSKGGWSLNVMEILWAFSIYLEAVAVLPQLKMLHQLEDTTNITMHYMASLGIYRAFYLLNWVYRLYYEGYWHPIAVVAGIVQTLLYADFFILYYQSVLLRLPSVTGKGGAGGRFSWTSTLNKMMLGSRSS